MAEWRATLRRCLIFPRTSIDYGAVISVRFALLRKAARRFATAAGKGGAAKAEYEKFCAEHAEWLEDYALFMAAKDAHGGKAWTRWEPELAARRPEALARWRKRLAVEIAANKFWQWEFFRQWGALREACRRHGIRIMGDVPIYVAHDSADVWTAPQYFWLDERGNPLKVAGVPPDYFSATGQLWGNPTYRWERLREDGFGWWKARMRGVLRLFDLVRMDHFRGFEAYFEIAAGAKTAMHGNWIKAPGTELFEALKRGVRRAADGGRKPGRDYAGGGGDAAALWISGDGDSAVCLWQRSAGAELPSAQLRAGKLVAYTGGHDNNTTVGWWTGSGGDSTSSKEDMRRERERASSYLNVHGEAIQWAMIRALMASVADTVLFPMQDLLGLGSAARMNQPGRMEGNWRWRYESEQVRPELAQRLRGWSSCMSGRARNDCFAPSRR